MSTSKPKLKDPHKWVQTVTTDTVAIEPGTMLLSPKKMADSLAAINSHLPNPKASINRYLQYYLNRGGKGISEERHKAVKRAQELIRKRYQ